MSADSGVEVMTTLVIHAPSRKVAQEAKRSFEKTLQSKVGDEYAINRHLLPRLNSGCRVVVLDKEQEKRAEGTLVKLEPRSKTDNGIQRYDVHIADLKRVEYQPEVLNRCGIAVF
jgi:hypothetical protein